MIQPSYIEIVIGDSSLITELSGTVECPTCSQPLPFSAFGVSRARHNGRNLYCKGCLRKKVAEARRELREYLAIKKQREVDPEIDRVVTRPLKVRYDAEGVLLPNELRLRCHDDHERVFAAIYHGARTQKEIMSATHICKDAIGDALAILLLGHPRRVRTHVVNDVRRYFPDVSVLRIRNSASGRAA